jgi:hypothetical protein
MIFLNLSVDLKPKVSINDGIVRYGEDGKPGSAGKKMNILSDEN